MTLPTKPDPTEEHAVGRYPIAVLLELARRLAEKADPNRSIVFVAFSGEEWGRKGSRHYIRVMKRWPAEEAIAMINLDSVGRLGAKKLLILGAGTAREWIHIVRGVGFETGIKTTAEWFCQKWGAPMRGEVL